MVSIQMVSVAPIRSHPLPDLVIKPLKHVQLSTKLRAKLKALPELGSTKATSKLIYRLKNIILPQNKKFS